MQWVTLFRLQETQEQQDKVDAGFLRSRAADDAKVKGKLVLAVGAWQVVEPHRYLVTLKRASLSLPQSLQDARKLTTGVQSKYVAASKCFLH